MPATKPTNQFAPYGALSFAGRIMAKVKQAVQVNVAAFIQGAIDRLAEAGAAVDSELIYPLTYAAFAEAAKHGEANIRETNAQGFLWALDYPPT